MALPSSYEGGGKKIIIIKINILKNYSNGKSI